MKWETYCSMPWNWHTIFLFAGSFFSWVPVLVFLTLLPAESPLPNRFHPRRLKIRLVWEFWQLSFFWIQGRTFGGFGGGYRIRGRSFRWNQGSWGGRGVMSFVALGDTFHLQFCAGSRRLPWFMVFWVQLHLPSASLCLLVPEVRSHYLHLDLIVRKNLYILVRGNEVGGMAVIY